MRPSPRPSAPPNEQRSRGALCSFGGADIDRSSNFRDLCSFSSRDWVLFYAYAGRLPYELLDFCQCICGCEAMPIGMLARAIVTQARAWKQPIWYLHGLTSAMHFIMLLVKCMAEVHRMHFKDVARVASCELWRFWLRDLSTIHLSSIGEWLWRCVSRPVQRGVSYDMSISENEESRTLPTYT